MAEDNKDQAESSDETIRRFLLGSLSLSEQPGFEQQLFLDDAFEARVRRAEFELADDYAYGRLDETVRDLFERKFLVTADRRRRVEVSGVLRERFASVSVAKPGGDVIERLRSLFSVTRPGWRLAFGAALLLILFATALLVVKEPRLTQRITNKIIPRRTTPQSGPEEVHHRTNDSNPEHQETPSPMPDHDQSPSSTVSVALAVDSGAVPTVNVPKGAQDIVRFHLAVQADQQGPYRAELLTIEGQTVFSAETIKTAVTPGAPVDFDVPAGLLKPGDFQIKLTRNNGGVTGEPRAYFFRVH
jgi:hypothetical protein